MHSNPGCVTTVVHLHATVPTLTKYKLNKQVRTTGCLLSIGLLYKAAIAGQASGDYVSLVGLVACQLRPLLWLDESSLQQKQVKL